MDEKKTYLIDFKDNLAEYTQRAADAKLEVDRLAAANKALKDSGTATTVQIEASNAVLRNAQQEYKNCTKSVDLATKANKAQKNSYEELYRQWQLAQTQLKLMGNGYTINSKGVRVLNQDYVRQRQVVADAKLALDNFGKSVHDNRLNVGSYSEALEGALGKLSLMPGFLGRAGMEAQGFMMAFSKMGVVGAAIAAVLGAISAPFIAFFKYSQEGMDLLAQKTSYLQGFMVGLKGKLIEVGEAWTEHITKKTEPSKWDELALKMGKVTQVFFRLLTFDVGRNTGVSQWLRQTIADASKTGDVFEDLKKKEQALESEENAMIVTRAKASYGIKEARLIYADTTKSTEERMTALKKAIDIENQTADQEVALAHRRTLIAQQREKEMAANKQDTREAAKLVEQAIAHEVELRTESVGREIRATKQLQSARHELLMEEYKLVEAEQKLWEDSAKAEIDRYNMAKSVLKAAYDEQTQTVGKSFEQREKMRADFELANRAIDTAALNKQKEILAEGLKLQLEQVDTVVQPVELANAQRMLLYQQYYDALQKLDADAFVKLIGQIQAENERKRQLTLADTKAGFERLRIEAEDIHKNRYKQLDSLNTVLDLEYAAMVSSVEYEKMTTEQRLLIDAKYTQAKEQLSLARISYSQQEGQALSESMGKLAGVFAENTAAHKFFAIAQALIDTYLAAAQAMADWSKMTVVEKIAAVSTVLAQGFALVNAIRGVPIGGSSGGNTAAAGSTLASSAAATRVLATPVGATTLQPSANQQANAAVINSGFNLDAITAAMAKLPPSIVTVEDINAKINQKQKVEVRANV